MLSHSAWPHRLSPSTTQIITLQHAQSSESGIEAGRVATISGSFFDEHYDTDHTDLGSEVDEKELRKELLKDVSILFNIKIYLVSVLINGE